MIGMRKTLQEITMVMPVYGGNMVDDEQHGRNQTWAKIAGKHFCLEFAKGLSTPAGPDLTGRQNRKFAILAVLGSSKATRSTPVLSSRRRGGEILF